jgi:hypothetical protein
VRTEQFLIANTELLPANQLRPPAAAAAAAGLPVSRNDGDASIATGEN